MSHTKEIFTWVACNTFGHLQKDWSLDTAASLVSAKECGGVLTDQQRIIQSPGFPEEYQDEQICYWHIRVRLGQRIRLHFLEFDVEDDMDCLADYLEVYDSYDDVSGFAGRSVKQMEPKGNCMICKELTLLCYILLPGFVVIFYQMIS